MLELISRVAWIQHIALRDIRSLKMRVSCLWVRCFPVRHTSSIITKRARIFYRTVALPFHALKVIILSPSMRMSHTPQHRHSITSHISLALVGSKLITKSVSSVKLISFTGMSFDPALLEYIYSHISAHPSALTPTSPHTKYYPLKLAASSFTRWSEIIVPRTMLLQNYTGLGNSNISHDNIL